MADKDDAVLHVIQNDHSYASVLSPRVSRHDLHRSPVSQHAAATSLDGRCRVAAAEVLSQGGEERSSPLNSGELFQSAVAWEQRTE